MYCLSPRGTAWRLSPHAMRTLLDGRVPPCAQCGVTDGDLPHVSRLIAELRVSVQ